MLPDGQVLAYDRCIGGHLQQITLDDDIVSVFERNDLHLEILRGQGRLHLRTSYDALSRRAVHWAHRRPLITPWSPEAPWRRISHPAGGDVVLKGFVYDAAGELERRNDALLGEVRYDYDPVRRVTGARTEPSSAHRLPVDERYAYDPAGNLVATGSQEGTWWEQPLAEGVRYNRLETLDDIRCSYDAHGRLIRRDARRDAEGLPAATTFEGISLVTTLPAAISVLSPICDLQAGGRVPGPNLVLNGVQRGAFFRVNGVWQRKYGHWAPAGCCRL